MKRIPTILAFGLWLIPLSLPADDVVKTLKATIPGRVTLSPTEVLVETPTAAIERVPVNQIEWISFEGEPLELKTIRSEVAKGLYEAALKALEKLKPEQFVRPEIRQELEFYRAFCAARLALAGSAEIAPAGRLMLNFVRDYPQSHHTLEAYQIVGDLLVAMGQYAKALPYYEKVAAAPWPDYQMRASVCVGQALLAENKPAEALKYFDTVLQQKVEGPLAETQRRLAILGKARCLAETGQAGVAVKAVEAQIASAESDDVAFLAQAYNTLGVALWKDNRPREALFAFLHVDALYSAHRESHAEALYHLARLCRELRKLDRAREFETTLKEQYAESRWNRPSTQ